MAENNFEKAKRLVRKIIKEYYDGDADYFEATNSSVESAEENFFLILRDEKNKYRDDYALIGEWLGV